MIRPSLFIPIGLLLVGCSQQAGKPLQSKDNRLEVTLPSGWESATLPNTIGEIQAKCPAKTAFAIVISEAKADFKQMRLEEYADIVQKLEHKKDVLEGGSITGPTKTKLNGVDVVQYEMRGTVKNVKICYLMTFIESPTRWNQIMCWTMPSHWEDSQDDFRKIAESFHENAAGQ